MAGDVLLSETASQHSDDRTTAGDRHRGSLVVESAAIAKAGKTLTRIAELTEGGSKRPSDSNDRLLLAWLQLRAGYTLEALGEFRELLQESHPNVDAISGYSLALLRSDLPGQVYTLLEQELTPNGESTDNYRDDPGLNGLMVGLLVDQGRYKEASERLGRLSGCPRILRPSWLVRLALRLRGSWISPTRHLNVDARSERISSDFFTPMQLHMLADATDDEAAIQEGKYRVERFIRRRANVASWAQVAFRLLAIGGVLSWLGIFSALGALHASSSIPRPPAAPMAAHIALAVGTFLVIGFAAFLSLMRAAIVGVVALSACGLALWGVSAAWNVDITTTSEFGIVSGLQSASIVLLMAAASGAVVLAIAGALWRNVARIEPTGSLYTALCDWIYASLYPSVAQSAAARALIIGRIEEVATSLERLLLSDFGHGARAGDPAFTDRVRRTVAAVRLKKRDLLTVEGSKGGATRRIAESILSQAMIGSFEFGLTQDVAEEDIVSTRTEIRRTRWRMLGSIVLPAVVATTLAILPVSDNEGVRWVIGVLALLSAVSVLRRVDPELVGSIGMIRDVSATSPPSFGSPAGRTGGHSQ